MIKLQIVQFNCRAGGGDAKIRLEGPAVESALNPDQYFLVQAGFFTRRIHEVVHHPEQEVVPIPTHVDRYLVVGFISVTSANLPRDYPQPDPSRYRRVVAQLLANMVANAQLEDLNVPVPLVTNR